MRMFPSDDTQDYETVAPPPPINDSNHTEFVQGTFNPFENVMVSFCLALVMCRFLYELKDCANQCRAYVSYKCREKHRLLKMKVQSDNLDDLLLSDCSVCLEDFVIGDEIMILPCHHHFHTSCAQEWLKHNRTCPLCRTDIFEDDI